MVRITLGSIALFGAAFASAVYADHHDGHHDDLQNVDDWHKHMNEVHRDVDGNLLHNNLDYDHVDDFDMQAHLEHEKLHHHAHTPVNDLDVNDVHEDIVTPHEEHHFEDSETEHHERDHPDEHAHSLEGQMVDHEDMIDHLHDPSMHGQGHELGVDAHGPEAGHGHGDHGHGDHGHGDHGHGHGDHEGGHFF